MHNLPLNSDATVAIEGIKARFNACQKFRYKLIEEYTSMWFKGCKKWKWVYEVLKNFGISCKPETLSSEVQQALTESFLTPQIDF